MPIESARAQLMGDVWEHALLLALHSHLPRQRWVEEVITKHLGASPTLLASDGGFGHPDTIPRLGVVPTMPQWSYRFHGCGCCLTHEDGTCIDVDFDREIGSAAIDPYFFSAYLDSLPAPTGVERWLRRPEPFSTCWMADLHGLRKLEWIEGKHRIRITERGALVAEQLAAEARARPYWDATDAVVLEARSRKLLACLDETRDPNVLLALASLGRHAVEGTVATTLAKPTVDAMTTCAVTVVESWGTGDYDLTLLSLASTPSSENSPMTYLRARVLEVVIGRYRADTLPAFVRTELLTILQDDGHGSEADLARYHYLLEPQEGLQRLARALEHPVPLTRSDAAAALTVIGTPECAAILRDAGTPESKSALELLRGLDLEPGPEPIGEEIMWRGKPRMVYRMDDLVAESEPAWVQASVEALTQSFAPLLQKWWSS